METTAETPALDIAVCLERVRQNDEAAARTLVEHLHPIVLRAVRRHLPRREAAEDLTQEIFVKMFRRLDQYRGTAPFTHWLSKITLRTCFDHLRAQRSRPELRYGDLSPTEVETVTAKLTDVRQRPANDTLGTRELLRLLLARLSKEDRHVIALFYLEQRSIRDICATTGWKTDFAKMRLFRARRKLQRAVSRLPHWDAGTIARPAIRALRSARRVRRAATEPRLALKAA